MKKRIIGWLGFIALFILAFIFAVYQQNNRDKEIASVFANHACVIGEVTRFNPESEIQIKTFSTSSVEYKYKLSNNNYISYGSRRENKIPKNGIREGEKYLVVINKDKPKSSVILFEYPIKDSSDLKKAEINFKKKYEIKE